MFYMHDYQNDYDSAVVIGKVKNGKPEQFGEDDGGVNFNELSHHQSIKDCFSYLQDIYPDTEFRKRLSSIKPDISLNKIEREEIIKLAG